MPFLEVLQGDDLAIVTGYLKPVHFPQNSCIMREGDPGDGCYILDEGLVRLEIQHIDTDSEGVLGFLEPGQFLGEFSLLDGQPRSASAFAHTPVNARWLSRADFQEICEFHPHVGIAISNALGQNLTAKFREIMGRMADYLFSGEIDASTNEMVARAVAAQRAFESWPEERVDALLQDLAEAVASEAESLAEATVSETGMGFVNDKVQKIRIASLDVYQTLAGRPASGLLHSDSQRHVMEYASPAGVILGLIPVTNPVPTLIFKVLIALKARNALILSCHRSALNVGNQAVDIIHTVLQRHDAPQDLVQTIRERTSRQKTMMFMYHPDVSLILATGGTSMVKAAYSSGTPAIGVGSGNAPVLICADADPAKVASIVVQSKSFDNGVICGSENNLVVVESLLERFIDMLEEHGAAMLTPDEKNRLTAHVFDPEYNTLRKSMVGQTAQVLAATAGIPTKENIRLLVVPTRLEELSGHYGREKLAPVLSLFTVKDEAEGFDVCKRILANQGSGHTAVIHSQNQTLIEQFGNEIGASRILVNTPASTGCIGHGNGLTPSFTLGCGTFGGNSTTDNITYTHLLNVKRLALNL